MLTDPAAAMETTVEPEAMQEPFVTLTLYVVTTVCVTVIVCVVAPLDQRYVEKPGPASSVKAAFGQTAVGPVMVTVGALPTLTRVWGEVALHEPFVTVTR